MKEETKNKPVKARAEFYAKCYEELKIIARDYGWNLVLHGSMSRDLDLIMFPWSSPICNEKKVLDRFCEFLGGSLQEEVGSMGFGRLGYVIDLERGGKWNSFRDQQFYLDIAVFPLPSGSINSSELV
ncbi:MAG: hypothetical protein MK081_14035 [Flavobacteriales bacterium]|nr:hypothetical protein [Flavobacteriales bacterium]